MVHQKGRLVLADDRRRHDFPCGRDPFLAGKTFPKWWGGVPGLRLGFPSREYLPGGQEVACSAPSPREAPQAPMQGRGV